MSPTSPTFHGKIYQIKLHLDGVSPMVWRRLLVRDDTNIAGLHGIFQLVMGWENLHLHCFVIHGKDYGIAYDGGMGFPDNPKNVFLRDFRFRPGDRFRYEYDFNIDWKLQIRVEKILDPIAGKQYPSCSGGNNAGPPEETQGIGAFSEIRELFRVPSYDLLRIIAFQESLGYPWRPDVFKRAMMNRWLKNGDGTERLYNTWFPHPDHPYFEDRYWFKKDELQILKRMYRVLKSEGIKIKEDAIGLDVCHKFLEEQIRYNENRSNRNPDPVGGSPQNS